MRITDHTAFHEAIVPLAILTEKRAGRCPAQLFPPAVIFQATFSSM
jgi:hypothetical protein